MIKKVCLYISLCLVLSAKSYTYAQNQEFTEINSLINQGLYSDAIEQIESLISDYPESTEASHSYIKYAFCLLEEKECGEETEYWLRKASKEQILSNEAQLNLLYGKFYHSNKMWSEAEESYKIYDNIASRKDKKNSHFEDIQSKCSKRELLFQPKTTLESDEAIRQEEERKQKQEAEQSIRLQYIRNNSASYSSIAEFIVNSDIKYNSIEQFKTNEGKYYYCKGKELESKISQIEQTIGKERSNYEKSTNISEKQAIAQEVIKLEKSLLSNQNTKDSMYSAVVSNESLYWNNAPDKEKTEFINNYLAQNTVSGTPDIDVAINNDTYTYELPELKTKKPDPVTYTVVIASYKKAPTYSMKQLNSKISKTRDVVLFTDVDNIKYYTVGSFKDKNIAKQLQAQLMLEGAKNAKVVGFLNNKRVDESSTTGKELGTPLPGTADKPQRGQEVIRVIE
ncbi:MAG: hypothetical protein ACK5IQ_07725 [Bacteroidales bacterium]